MELSRKRKLSTEASYLPQVKCYVDQNTQNRQNEKKMQEIYSKCREIQLPDRFSSIA